MHIKRISVVWSLFLILVLTLPAFAGVSPDGVWEEITATTTRSALSSDREPWIKPDVLSLFKLDGPSLAAVLKRAPAVSRDGAARAPLETAQLTLPAPDGRFITIVFTDAPIMAPELAAHFPDIKTYTGYLADDPTTTVAFDWTPSGFHAQVLSTEGPWYIDPYMPGESYASYFKRDYHPDKKFTDYPALRTDARTSLTERSPLAAAPLKTDQIRKYRLALACTAEYARYQCGGVCGDNIKPMAAMNTTINRVNQIYKRELAIEFELVKGNENLIYLDPQTAPFTNGNSERLLEQSQAVIDKVIGDANYDIGHVFSLNGGGLSTLGVPCQSGRKAMALTGTDTPKGDAFDVDYVCHEMGHQFNADHTYNGKLGSCSTDQYVPLAAYEPGSATSIMSYCGQCEDDNIQLNNDLTFHSVNFDQVQTYVAGKGSCGILITTPPNAAPVVQPLADATIPRNTPFTLTGTATDADVGDVLTYLWEEFDLGGKQASLSEPDDGKMPLFRLYQPTLTGTRTFPKMGTIASGIADKTERLPQIGRTMNFRLIARDGNGGVAQEEHDNQEGGKLGTVPGDRAARRRNRREQLRHRNLGQGQYRPVSDQRRQCGDPSFDRRGVHLQTNRPADYSAQQRRLCNDHDAAQHQHRTRTDHGQGLRQRVLCDLRRGFQDHRNRGGAFRKPRLRPRFLRRGKGTFFEHQH